MIIRAAKAGPVFGIGLSLFLLRSRPSAIIQAMAHEKLTPADPPDIAGAIAFALLFSGRKRVHDSDKYMAAIAADRIVRHLQQARYVVMKRPPIVGGGDNPGRTGAPDR